MNNLAEVIEEVNVVEEIDRIFGRFQKETKCLVDVIQESRRAIERGFCSKHEAFKTDLFREGSLICEVCFEISFHCSDEGLEDEVIYV